MLELTIRLIASLAVVVGLLLLLARFGGRRFRGRAGDLVRVVHRQPLTRTSSVAVVTVGTRVLVLGTTEQQVSILTELDPDELDDVVTGEAEVAHLVAAPAPRAAGAHRADVPAKPVKAARGADGALAGSVLSAQTWRQALAAATGKAS
jgi:flagellar protein FliO/FliZ